MRLVMTMAIVPRWFAMECHWLILISIQMNSNVSTTGTRFQNPILQSFSKKYPSFLKKLDCNRKSSKYDCACSHPEYQLVELKSGHQCVRPFLGFYTFDEAQMICNFDRSSILAPNDLEDAETFQDLASNGNDIWLPFK